MRGVGERLGFPPDGGSACREVQRMKFCYLLCSQSQSCQALDQVTVRCKGVGWNFSPRCAQWVPSHQGLIAEFRRLRERLIFLGTL